MSAKRSGWHRPKPAVIDAVLPGEVALTLISDDTIIELESENMLRGVRALNDESRQEEPATKAAHRAIEREIAKGWQREEDEASIAYVVRLRQEQRRTLAMTLEVARLHAEAPYLTQAEIVDAVASSFVCDTRTVARACDEWLSDSDLFRSVLGSYRNRVAQRKP